MNDAMKFRTYLMAVLLVSVTIPCFVMSGLQYKMASEDIAKEERVQQQLSESTGKELLSRIQIAQHLLLTASEFVKIEGLKDSGRINKFLESLRENFPDFLNIHIDNASGFSVSFSPERNSRGESNIGVDHTGRDHWLNRTTENRVQVSGLVNAQGAATGNIINLSTPITQDKRIMGYAVAAVNLKKLAEQVLPQSSPERYEIAIADGSGKIIFSTSKHFPIPEIFPSAAIEKVKEEGTAWVSLNFGKDKEEFFRSYLSSVPEAGWIVAVLSSQKAREELIWKIALSNGLAWLSILLLTAIASIFVSSPLVNSIGKLSSQITAGRSRPLKGEVVTIPKELRMLQHKFSSVSSQLNHANTELFELNAKLQDEVEKQVKKVTEREGVMTAVFTGLSEGLVLLDENNILRFANEASVNIFGKELAGKSLDTLFEEKTIQRLKAGGTLPVICPLDNGKVLSLRLFFLADSEYLKKALFIRDVTSEEQLNKLKEDLIGVVAHELKSPLSAIRLEAEEIRRMSGLDEVKEKADELLRDSDSMKKLIESWLDVSRMEAGAYQIHKELCMLAPLVRKALRITRANGDFDFNVDIHEDAKIIWVDRDAFVQILTNLISNAVRYGHPERKPVISLEAYKEDNNLILTFTDNGVGIEPSKINKVFEKFYQVEMNSKRKPGGTGLGLVIVKGLIELHQGSIKIQSEVGRGTVFIITLPLPEAK